MKFQVSVRFTEQGQQHEDKITLESGRKDCLRSKVQSKLVLYRHANPVPLTLPGPNAYTETDGFRAREIVKGARHHA